MAMSCGFLNRLRTALRAKPEDGLTNILADLAVGHPDDRLDKLDPLLLKLGEETALRMLCRIFPNLANAAKM